MEMRDRHQRPLDVDVDGEDRDGEMKERERERERPGDSDDGCWSEVEPELCLAGAVNRHKDCCLAGGVVWCSNDADRDSEAGVLVIYLA